MPEPVKDGEGAAPVVELTAEQLKAQLAEKEAQLTAANEKLAKAADKEFNFKQLRDMTEDEKAKLSEREKEILQRQEKLEAETKSFVKQQVDTHQNDALAALAGDDKEARDRILFHYNRIVDTAVTREEIFAKMRDAAKIAMNGQISADPFRSAVAYSGGMNQSHPKGELTSEQRDLAAKMGMTEEDLKKYSK